MATRLASGATKSLKSAVKRISPVTARKTVGTGSTYNTRLRPVGGAAPTTAVKKPVSTSSTSRSGSSSSRSGYSSSSRSGYSSNRNYSYSRPTYARSSGSGGGGGTRPTGNVVAPVAPATGLAANYLPTAADLFMEDPTLLARDLLTQKYGADGARTLLAQMTPIIENANALYLASQGQTAANAPKWEWINWLGSLINQQQTPGQFYDHRTAINNLLAPVAGSPLRGFVTEGDALQQATNFNRIFDPVLEAGVHRLMAEGIRNNVRDAQAEHAIASSKAAVDPFITYLRAKNPDLTTLLGVV